MQQVLISTPVVFKGANSSTAQLRTLLQQQTLMFYAEKMLLLWLHLRTFMSKDEMSENIRTLIEAASEIAQASTWRVQSAFTYYPVFFGVITEADILLAGFNFVAKQYKHMLSNSEFVPKFVNWGPNIQLLRSWASTVEEVVQPSKEALQMRGSTKKHKPAFYAVARGFKPGIYTDVKLAKQQWEGFSFSAHKKFSSLEEAKQFMLDNKDLPTPSPSRKKKKYTRKVCSTPVKSKSAVVTQKVAPSPGSSSSVWWVAKGTSRPGIYKHKEVAESYRVGNVGSIIKSFSLQRAHNWFGEGAPVFYESVSSVRSTEMGYWGHWRSGAPTNTLVTPIGAFKYR